MDRIIFKGKMADDFVRAAMAASEPPVRVQSDGCAASCGWYSGPDGRQCGSPATAKMLAAHWRDPVPVCKLHAVEAKDCGFDVLHNDDLKNGGQ